MEEAVTYLPFHLLSPQSHHLSHQKICQHDILPNSAAYTHSRKHISFYPPTLGHKPSP